MHGLPVRDRRRYMNQTSFGLQGGLERVTKVMMIILLAIMVVSGDQQHHDRRLRARGCASITESGFSERMQEWRGRRQCYRCPARDDQQCGFPRLVARHRPRWQSSGKLYRQGPCAAWRRPSMLRFWIRSVAIYCRSESSSRPCFAFGVATGQRFRNLIFVTLPYIFNHMAPRPPVGQPVLFVFMAFSGFLEPSSGRVSRIS